MLTKKHLFILHISSNVLFIRSTSYNNSYDSFHPYECIRIERIEIMLQLSTLEKYKIVGHRERQQFKLVN